MVGRSRRCRTRGVEAATRSQAVMGELFYLKIAQSAAAAKSMRMIVII
jgi:hypothetical protein